MSAVPVPSANCLLVVDLLASDRSTGSIASGQQLSAWVLSIPAGQTAAQAASAFALQQNVPPGTVAMLLDFTVSPPAYGSFQLTESWQAD